MKNDLTAVANINGKECAEKIGFIKDDQVHYRHLVSNTKWAR